MRGSADRRTLALGAVATATFAAVVVGELARVWRRGSAPLPSEADEPLQAAAEAVAETAEVAWVGYRESPTRENALLNLVSSFVGTFVLARGITFLLRRRTTVGPFRNLRVGRRSGEGAFCSLLAGDAVLLGGQLRSPLGI